MTDRRRVVVLGGTGSIGESAQRVIRSLGDRIELVGISAHSNVGALLGAAAEFRPAAVCLSADDADPAWADRLPAGTRAMYGSDGLVELATMDQADLVLVAIVGTGGLRPALEAIRAGKDLAVASKEILVMAGGIVMREAARQGVRVLPVDSEHNAIFQCIDGRDADSVSRLILTCSGGPFRKLPADAFGSVTPEMALKHPTWTMGRKITIDSATLFNKGLEMIEAHWLFGVPMDRIDVVVHPQSIAHSFVEFVDGSQLGQFSHSDMAFPIQYAFTWPDRVMGALRPLNLATAGTLEFEAPRENDFPALRLARKAGSVGGSLPAVLNAANEVAVDAFLAGAIRFPQIWETVESVMANHCVVADPSLDDLLAADADARKVAASVLSQN